MSHGAEAILNLLDELGGEEAGSQKVLGEIIQYLRSDELIKFVHHFRSMHDMIDDDPDEEEEPDDTTEDMPEKPKCLYPGHSPGYERSAPSYDPIDW